MTRSELRDLLEGGACTTAVLVAQESVSIEGSPASFTLEAESGAQVSRLFCQRCGSPLFARNTSGPALLAVKVATLDDPTWVRPGVEISTDSAPPWALLAHDLPRFAKNFGGT